MKQIENHLSALTILIFSLAMNKIIFSFNKSEKMREKEQIDQKKDRNNEQGEKNIFW